MKKETYHDRIIFPGVSRLLSKLAPKSADQRLLDVACGEGAFERYLVGEGRTLPIDAFDAAPGLIRSAESQFLPYKAQTRQVHFFTLNAERMQTLKAKSYTQASIILALQNITRLDAVVEGLSHALMSGGVVAVVLNHPTFRVPGASAWETKDGILARRIDRYLSSYSTDIIMNPGAKEGERKIITTSYHRSLQDYVKAFTSKDFALVALEEWISDKKSEGKHAEKEDRARKEFPLFLTMVFKKL